MKRHIGLLVVLAIGAIFMSAFGFSMSDTYTRDGRPPRPRNVQLPLADRMGYTELSERTEGLELRGRIPYLTEACNVADSINAQIEMAVDSKIAEAREARARSITFSYYIFSANNPDITSIVIKSTAASASSKTDVISINFESRTGAPMRVDDVVGVHVVQLADRLLMETVRRNPQDFNPGFSGMRRNQAFSVTRDEVVFWFDEFQLRSGSEGVVRFPLRFNDILEYTITSDRFHTRPGFNVMMVPLRDVVEALGYEVEMDWEGRVVIYHNNERVIRLTPGENDYSREGRRGGGSRSLESAPELIGDHTYVPISFFDQILNLVTFSIDNNGNITFASYNVTDSWFRW